MGSPGGHIHEEFLKDTEKYNVTLVPKHWDSDHLSHAGTCPCPKIVCSLEPVKEKIHSRNLSHVPTGCFTEELSRVMKCTAWKESSMCTDSFQSHV